MYASYQYPLRPVAAAVLVSHVQDEAEEDAEQAAGPALPTTRTRKEGDGASAGVGEGKEAASAGIHWDYGTLQGGGEAQAAASAGLSDKGRRGKCLAGPGEERPIRRPSSSSPQHP